LAQAQTLRHLRLRYARLLSHPPEGFG
jgi:hypothetical protein